MEIITKEEEKQKIEKELESKKINLLDFVIFNTSWAKDKDGERDTTNLSLFLKFAQCNRYGKKILDGGVSYWQLKEIDKLNLDINYGEVAVFNRTKDSGGKEFNSK